MTTISELLFRGESESLDFKRDQYPFSGCDDHTKAKLLKDILAMANSWRSETAYILIGIDDTSPRQIVGVSDHFDDADLQQFVTSKIQNPLKFSYFPMQLDEHSIGVIEIPVQTRPIYLRKDFGGLKANTVYLRRGSSTDIASPDEIAKMGSVSTHLAQSDLLVEFAKPNSRELLGVELKFDSTVYNIADEPNVPDFSPKKEYLPYPDFSFITELGKNRKPNRDFYRELLRWAKERHLMRHTSLTVTNRGTITAKDIRVEFSLSDPQRHWEFRETHEVHLDLPVRYNPQSSFGVGSLRPISYKGDSGCEVQYLDGVWHIVFEFGHLQPGRTLWPSIEFFMGACQTGSAQLEGKVMADGLPSAATSSLTIMAQVSEIKTNLNELETVYANITQSETDDSSG